MLANGPGGQTGIVLADPERCQRLAYKVADQRWVQMLGKQAWLGIWKDDPPGPADLARVKMLDGHNVELLDKQMWQVPLVRQLVEEEGEQRYVNLMPVRSTRDENGRWEEGQVLESGKRLWDLATSWWDAKAAAAKKLIVAAEDSNKPIDDDAKVILEFDFEGLHTKAIAALATNYRVGPDECDLLGLLSEDLTIDILDALVDWPARVAWVKKNAGSGG